MTLRALQRDFRTWLQSGKKAAAARFDDAAQPGLAVYQNNYRAQLAACLEDSFQATRDWIGGDAFHAAVVEHIERVSPASWTLDAYPRDFPATLDAIYPDDAEVGELAWLEMALAEAFVAPDAEPVDAATLGDVEWDDAVLGFTPSLDFRAITTNAPAIWSAIRGETPPPAAETLPTEGALIVWRQGFLSRFRTTDTLEMEMLARASAGTPFGKLCAIAIAEAGPDGGAELAGQWLAHWLGDGLLVNVSGACV